MDPNATTIYPVILPVPAGDQVRSGREKVRSLSRHARAALRLSCEKIGLVLHALPKDAKGVPLPVGGVYWSLSHKTAIAGGVASPQPVGLDLETVRPVSRALLAKVADETEWRLADGKNKRAFFRFWTAKEAVLKAVGKGMTGLSRCKVVNIFDEARMTLTYENTRWPVAHIWFNGHVAALASRQFDIAWTIHGHRHGRNKEQTT